MKNHQDGLKRLGSFIPSEAQIKKKFKVMMPPASLFGNDWSALKRTCCPLCGLKLRVNHKTLAVYCNRVRSNHKPFYMTKEKVLQVIKEL